MSAVSKFAPREIAPGLWRWTAAHPEWRPGAAPDSPADWGPDVGCVLCLLDGAAVFIDALAPRDPRFWPWADERVAGAGRCAALTTISFHRRSREELVARYRATTSRARAQLPEGIETIHLRGAGEVAYWIAGHRALVCGDRVLGAAGGGLRLCPESWLGYLGGGLAADRLRGILAPLLELPVERVLVSHGQPVLAGGHAALAEAIG